MTNGQQCGIIGLTKRKEVSCVNTQDRWSEMSYYKYKNPKTLKERLEMEEEDIFDIYDEEDEDKEGAVIEE